MDKKTQHMHDAAKLLRAQHSGVLSTVSLSLKGFPFGSVTPFLMTQNGDIVIYASDIAQHSRNIKTNEKVSLCVHDNSQSDSQASARVTIVGNAAPDMVNESLQEQYLTVFPQAKAYTKAHDFRFYLISTYKVRYIGGFGEIYWFSNQEWQSLMHSLEDNAKNAIVHMHQDHADALSQIVSYHTGQQIKEGAVTMLSCFQHGFHFGVTPNETTKTAEVEYQKTRQNIGFVPFVKAINADYDLRKAMVDLTHMARKTKPVFMDGISSQSQVTQSA